MGQLTFILGTSGTGKSTSMENFPHDKLAVCNVLGKMLPFRGGAEIEQTVTDDSVKIMEALDDYSKKYRSIVIDDFQYIMSNEFMRRSNEGGWDKFTEIARHAWDICNKVRSLPDDVIVYIMCHTDRSDDGTEKIKTIGRLLDEKICLEGMSPIVLKTCVSDGQYSFLTQNNGKDTVKSPKGMFPTYAINNDLWYVDQAIRNYFGLKTDLPEDTIKEMEEAAQMPEVTKDTAEGRRRRKVQKDTGTGAIVGATPEEQRSEETAAPAKRERRRKADGNKEQQTEEAPAEEKKEEGTAAEGEKPKKRRRKKRDDGEALDGFMNIPDGTEEETPFDERDK